MSLAGCGAGGGSTEPPVESPTHEHTWADPTYTWSDDYSSCTAERVCTQDNTHKENEIANSTYTVVTEASCETDGLGRYTVSFKNSAFLTQTHDTVMEALGHDYQFDSFVWTDFTAQAKYVCLHNDEHVRYFDAEVTDDVILEPKCVETGTKIYYASYDGHVDSKTEILPALGHDLVHHDGRSPTCLENGYDAYDTCTRCDYSTYRTLNSIGHNWGDPIYTWAEDYSSCTATRVCSNNSEHSETETVDSTHEIINSATMGREGLGRYTVTFTNEAFETQTKDVAIAKLDPTVPVIDREANTVTYGLYPQTVLEDQNGIYDTLNALTTPESNGWYLYNDEYYAKLSATPDSSRCFFDNGKNIVSGTTYWFKCEPITWNILPNKYDVHYLLSSVLLDVYRYDVINYNNYANSEIRSFLNNDFYNSAFALGNDYIRTTTVNNSASTTDSSSNPYACSNTNDKIFLPSYQDYINSSYGFSTSKNEYDTSRKCKTTDWARARGALHSDSYKNGPYWTRSPSSGSSTHAWYVSSGGTLGTSTTGTSYCVRPSFSFKIS